ncbi:PKD-like family lipoprotein [Carboxylicivirga marina]|uniref:PKD-like family protein n=1 Tax=Carboxylicivirga marina TaxID=2800988 RepID=A0ABS1HDT7_9BACT|nr:PKD-like family lipoprotein [Carboxylicivirga marina]MBK3515843.1 hypothetical protein [Carboxylicivirga marina]
MKVKYHTIIVLIISLVIISCAKDDSTFQTIELNEFSIGDFEAKYSLVSIQDTIKINPEIMSEGEEMYQYMWMYYEKVIAGKVTRFDTISYEKDIEFQITMPPGEYELVFQATQSSTGISKYQTTDLSVVTASSRGWYILKEEKGNTELDLNNKGKVSANMISGVWGRPLRGKPVQISYAPYYNWIDPETNASSKRNKVLVPLSEEEMFILRYDDLKILRDFSNSFFEKVPERQAPNFFIANYRGMFLGNDGQAYSIDNQFSNSGLFGAAKLSNTDIGLSNQFIQINEMASPLVYNTSTSSFCTIRPTSSYLVGFQEEGRLSSINYPLCRNLDADLQYLGRQSRGFDSSGTGIAILKSKSTGEQLLGHLELNALGFFGGLKNPLFQLDGIAPDLQLTNADCYGVNRDYQFLYFSIGSSLYSFNIKYHTEEELLVMPGGEEITFIEHYQYDIYDDEENQFDKLVVATFDGVNYKIYLYDTLAGIPTGEPEIMQGVGKVHDMFYMSPYITEWDVAN